MKKIQILFAALAITVASVGVFASSMVTTTYWRAQTPDGADQEECFEQVTITPCEGSINQCRLDVFNNGNLYRISKKVSPSTTCEKLLKN